MDCLRTCDITLRRFRVTIAAAKIAMSITYYECVSLAIVIQHATRMSPAVFPFVACQTPPYFSTLSRKRNEFRKTLIEHKIRVLSVSTCLIGKIFRSKGNSVRLCRKFT